jgi:hypothetical protein
MLGSDAVLVRHCVARACTDQIKEKSISSAGVQQQRSGIAALWLSGFLDC